MGPTDVAEVGAVLGTAMGWGDVYARLSRDRGDPIAYQALTQRTRQNAHRDLWMHGRHLVDDAAADTATAVILSFARARGADTFAGFVYGQYLDVRRRILTDVKRHHVPFDADIENRPAVSDPCGYPTPDQLAALRSCLLHLVPRERRAVELRYLEQASSERIATELGVTPENARRLVCNGLAHLRREMPRVLALVSGKPA